MNSLGRDSWEDEGGALSDRGDVLTDAVLERLLTDSVGSFERLVIRRARGVGDELGADARTLLGQFDGDTSLDAAFGRLLSLGFTRERILDAALELTRKGMLRVVERRLARNEHTQRRRRGDDRR